MQPKTSYIYTMQSQKVVDRSAKKLSQDIELIKTVLASVAFDDITPSNKSTGLEPRIFRQAILIKKNLKNRYQRGGLEPTTVSELELSGFIFDYSSHQFNQQVEKLCNLQSRYPNKKITEFKPKDPEASAPRQWLLRQIKPAKWKTLSEEQKTLLQQFF